ncbi:uncharacterized protein JN550_012878 [Neoarthrinium moseri]|uniref:uncharacterized protein n=1 Tax=Neoarthrinium moseri TaxID=1658444 RepID=UPI001FDE1E48|nr:uncharacterized protein JN550_012878 [Neoarthrinium moseri]KAI1858056.1 hypothetical protein JN550_012878 [Neoarthrinium moseri]
MAFFDILKCTALYTFYSVTFFAIGVFSYRLLLHPLRGYPGPFVAKISDAHNGFFAINKRLHIVTREDHIKYGSVMRHGPNKLVFNTVQALHDIYGNERFIKSHIYNATTQTPGVYNTFNVIDKDAHRSKLKIVGKVVNERGMRFFEPTMQEQINIFLRTLGESSSESSASPVNMTDNIRNLACDIIGLLAFGYPLELQTTATNHFMVKGMALANWLVNTRMQWFRIQQSRINDLLILLDTGVREQYKRLLERMIKGRLSEDKHIRHDLYSIASEANEDLANPGGSIRLSDIWAEAAAFFPAGAFSTSGALSALFFYLVRYPECYDRLASEIRSTFSNRAEIKSGPQLSSCLYLRACIDESLRISPPVPGTLWRERASSDNDPRPIIVEGHEIPKGIHVGVNSYALHHNDAYFPEPFRFMPERWLPSESSEEQRKIMNAAFSPFSIGYRTCAGKSMAYLESSLVIALTLWYFDFEAAPGKLAMVGGGTPGSLDGRAHTNEYQLYDTFNGAHDGPYLVFRPREDYIKDFRLRGQGSS